MEKTYLVVATRAESKDIISLELLDESSVPPIIKTAVFRLGKDEFEALGAPNVIHKIKVTLEKAQTVVEPTP